MESNALKYTTENRSVRPVYGPSYSFADNRVSEPSLKVMQRPNGSGFIPIAGSKESGIFKNQVSEIFPFEIQSKLQYLITLSNSICSETMESSAFREKINDFKEKLQEVKEFYKDTYESLIRNLNLAPPSEDILLDFELIDLEAVNEPQLESIILLKIESGELSVKDVEKALNQTLRDISSSFNRSPLSSCLIPVESFDREVDSNEFFSPFRNKGKALEVLGASQKEIDEPIRLKSGSMIRESNKPSSVAVSRSSTPGVGAIISRVSSSFLNIFSSSPAKVVPGNSPLED